MSEEVDLPELGADPEDDFLERIRLRGPRPTPREAGKIQMSRYYVRVQWAELAATMLKLNTDRATRLWILLKWQTKIEAYKNGNGWVRPHSYMLERLGLRDSHYSVVVDKLEQLGVIEVRRERRGKSPLLRLL
jgi:hypothetical protein